MPTPPVDLDAILEARQRIAPYAHRTPVLTCSAIDDLVEASLYFKCENFQKAGAFKFRGATNAVFSLSHEEAARGVTTHSSGNHAGALALAGKLRGIKVRVVMPSDAPLVKQAAVRGYGAEITFSRPTLADREATTAAVIAETGATLVHPYDNEKIIAGQATAVMELLEDVPDLDLVLCPLGGGGLLSGTLLAAKSLKPQIRVIGCEPRLADDGLRSLRAGHIMPVERTDTIADGLRTALGDLTYPIIAEYVEDIALAGEEDLVEAMRLLFERAKIVVEPSAGIGLAALLGGTVRAPKGKIGIILSGGNVDLAKLPFAKA